MIWTAHCWTRWNIYLGNPYAYKKLHEWTNRTLPTLFKVIAEHVIPLVAISGPFLALQLHRADVLTLLFFSHLLTVSIARGSAVIFKFFFSDELENFLPTNSWKILFKFSSANTYIHYTFVSVYSCTCMNFSPLKRNITDSEWNHKMLNLNQWKPIEHTFSKEDNCCMLVYGASGEGRHQ